MTQGSDEWISWRKAGIGASDTPIIMGVSPYKSCFQLWEEKLGIRTEIIDDAKKALFAKGHSHEPIIRKLVETKLNQVFNPALYIKSGKDYMRASLDGISAEAEAVLEIKYANKADHELARSGKVPDKYLYQIQHQLSVVNYHKAIYASYNEKQDDLQIVVVPRNQKIIDDIEKAVDSFWLNNILKKVAPELSDMDYVEVTDFAIEEEVLRYKKLSSQAKEIELKLIDLKKSITEKLPHVACKILNHKVFKVSRKGSVNYLKIPEIKGVDLEQYRGKSVDYWIIK